MLSRRYWCVEGTLLGTERGQQKRLQEQIAALILRQAKGQPKTSGY